MGFLFIVSSLTFSELELLGEGFPTYTTSMGFLSCVNSFRFREQRLLEEGFPTFNTFMDFLYFVCLLKFKDLWLSPDGFSTFMKLNFSMSFLMISMEKGSSMFIKLSRFLYVTVSAWLILTVTSEFFHVNQAYHDLALKENDFCSEEQYFQMHCLHNAVPSSSVYFGFVSAAEGHHQLPQFLGKERTMNAPVSIIWNKTASKTPWGWAGTSVEYMIST